MTRNFRPPAPSPLRLNPNISGHYRRKVTALSQTLSDPEVRTQALGIICGLIERVTVKHKTDGITLGLEGALMAMIGIARNARNPSGEGLGTNVGTSSVKVVAGVELEPKNFRL